MAAYLKFIEQARARTVLLIMNETNEATAALMRKVNGVLFTGRDDVIQAPDGTFSTYTQKVKFIFDY